MKNGKYIEDGTECWYRNGQRHREDGPAIITRSGTQQWYLNGKLHRTCGPAIIYTNGTKQWLLNGNHHRLDGPAIEWANGENWYYINHIKLKYQDWLEKRTPLLIQENLKTLI